MKHEQWFERLEAYLDGELSPGPRVEFEAAAAADLGLRAELEARRDFRVAARRALSTDLPQDLQDLAIQALRAGYRSAPRRNSRRWAVLAIAAALIAAVLVPTLVRNIDGAAGPRSSTFRSGQVVAVRFGEQPGRAVHLEAVCFDQNQGVCQ